jgi:hypothetical protein
MYDNLLAHLYETLSIGNRALLFVMLYPVCDLTDK